MHCEPERWDVEQPTLPELIEMHRKQAKLLRSETIARSLRALFRARQRVQHPKRTLYARLATWPQ